MNALAEQHKGQKAALVSGAAVAGIVPTTIEEVFRLASAVHSAGLAPFGLETPEKLTIAIMTGLEVGLPPMQAVQSIAVINNRPTIWGDGLMAIVRRSSLCRYIKEWIEGDGDQMIAFCETHRTGEEDPVTRSFSVADAKKARLWQTAETVTKQGKNGPYTKDNDSPWFRFPKRMLQMRARALCLRDVYADLTRGIQVREEVEDYPAKEPRDVTPASSPAETIAARLRASQPQQQAIGTAIVDHVESELSGNPGEFEEAEVVDGDSDGYPEQSALGEAISRINACASVSDVEATWKGMKSFRQSISDGDLKALTDAASTKKRSLLEAAEKPSNDGWGEDDFPGDRA